MNDFKFEVSAQDHGRRLDVFLKEKMPEHSRNQIQHWITQGAVLCGGKIVKPSYELSEAQIISGQVAQKPSLLQAENIPLEVLYEDDLIIVVNKPAGMVTHPAVGHKHATLANALAWHFKGGSAYKKGGSYVQESLRPGIVHRLDKETSGVIVAAKTLKVLENLSAQFRSRSVQKVYRTIICGVLNEKKGEIIGSIASGQHSVKMRIVPGGKQSQTNFSVLQRFKNHTYLEVYPKTGRTHQIRVHLAEIGRPILGDELYGAASDLCARQMLHAWQLTILHPKTKKLMSFNAPLPKDFLTALKRLK